MHTLALQHTLLLWLKLAPFNQDPPVPSCLQRPAILVVCSHELDCSRFQAPSRSYSLFFFGMFLLAPRPWVQFLLLQVAGFPSSYGRTVACIGRLRSLYPFTHGWTLGLLLYVGCCEQCCGNTGAQTALHDVAFIFFGCKVRLLSNMVVVFLIFWGKSVFFPSRCTNLQSHQ